MHPDVQKCIDLFREATDFYLKPDICGPCGGKCCKHMPGAAFPDDFPTKEALHNAIKSGRYAIDWWEGDAREDIDELSRTYYIRPAIKGEEGRIMHPSWGGECTFLTDKGCELMPENRPTECRQLEPDEKGNCVLHGESGKRYAAMAWIGRSSEFDPFTVTDEELDEIQESGDIPWFLNYK